MSIFCKIGIHRYATINEGDYNNLGISHNPTIRECLCCGKTQELVKHCLGLNPPEYYTYWTTNVFTNEKPKNKLNKQQEKDSIPCIFPDNPTTEQIENELLSLLLYQDKKIVNLSTGVSYRVEDYIILNDNNEQVILDDLSNNSTHWRYYD